MQRIGVFVCHCGSNIAATVDVKKVVEMVSHEPGVVHAEDYQYMCSEAGQNIIKDAIKEYHLTGVVICSCSPRMHEATFRDNRIVDAAVSQSMASSPSFFASTTIFIIGGLIAAIGAGDKTAEMVHDLPFTTPTTTLVLDLKLLVLTGIFVHAFFRFTWSMRQYSFGALLIGATPSSKDFEAAADATLRRRHANRAGRVLGLAAETFNDGLRAVYLSFAAVLWFLSPLAFVVGTVLVIAVLYRREFHSDVLAQLNEPVESLHPPAAG